MIARRARRSPWVQRDGRRRRRHCFLGRGERLPCLVSNVLSWSRHDVLVKGKHDRLTCNGIRCHGSPLSSRTFVDLFRPSLALIGLSLSHIVLNRSILLSIVGSTMMPGHAQRSGLAPCLLVTLACLALLVEERSQTKGGARICGRRGGGRREIESIW